MIDKSQWGEFGQDTGVTPLLFTRSAMGFLMTIESQDLGLKSHPNPGALGPPQTQWAPPAGLTNTSSSSNLVFPGGLPSKYWPAQPSLASVGDRSWAAGWYGCGIIIIIIYESHLCKICDKYMHKYVLWPL